MEYLVYVLLNLCQQTHNGLTFVLPSKHTLQNMVTHQILRVTEPLEMVRLRQYFDTLTMHRVL